MYDVTERKTFENTRAWLTEIKEYAPPEAVVMLLGNKCDVTKERVVRREEGERLAGLVIIMIAVQVFFDSREKYYN